jgi:carbon-monoxide dehydrogenase medium subunit
MIPERFDYRTPSHAAEAAALLASDPGGARVLGGGTWLIPEMSRGEARPRMIIDLSRAGLATIDQTGDELTVGGLTVGAMATYADLLDSPLVARVSPLLALVAGSITGGWSIRNQGTVGGSVVAARPQSDIPAALVACGAQAVLHGPRGTRRLPVAELIDGPMSTTLGPGELVAAFEIPASPTGVGYSKLKRGASSWPIVTASAIVTVERGTCTSARLVLGAAAATPIVVDVAEALVGSSITGTALQAAQRVAAAAVTEPWDDMLAPGDYRAAVAGPVARRALTMAFETEARGS